MITTKTYRFYAKRWEGKHPVPSALSSQLYIDRHLSLSSLTDRKCKRMFMLEKMGGFVINYIGMPLILSFLMERLWIIGVYCITPTGEAVWNAGEDLWRFAVPIKWNRRFQHNTGRI